MSKVKTHDVEVEKPKMKAYFFPKEERSIMATSRAEALEILNGEKQE